MQSRSLRYSTVAAIAFVPGDGRSGPVVFIGPPTEVMDLKKYRLTHRPVLIFADSETEPAYVEQRAALQEAVDGLVERDIVVLSDTDPADQAPLRRLFGAEGFEVLLIGKDGGLKLRQGEPIGVDALFAVIDAMPMRRQEMGR
jgi:hypothetical protein